MPILPSASDLGKGCGDPFLGAERQIGIADSGQQQEAFCLCPFGVHLSSDYEKLAPREARSLEASLQCGERDDRVRTRRFEEVIPPRVTLELRKRRCKRCPRASCTIKN